MRFYSFIVFGENADAFCYEKSSVADPHWFQCGSGKTDPDTAFYVNADADPDPGLHKGRPSNRRSLYPSKKHLALQKLNSGPPESGSVFPMLIRIQPTKMNAAPCGSGSATLEKINIF
jgi:hypothetical protein